LECPDGKKGAAAGDRVVVVRDAEGGEVVVATRAWEADGGGLEEGG
jgi:hypothetical protein